MPIENIAIWIPFLAITLGTGTIVTLIVTLHRAKLRELDQRHKERMAAIEKGLDPAFGSGAETAEPLRAPPSWAADRPPPPKYLLRGLIWLGVGLAFGFSSGGVGFGWAGLPGWIAAAVGGAYVAYYLVEGRRAPPPAPPPERPPGADRGH